LNQGGNSENEQQVRVGWPIILKTYHRIPCTNAKEYHRNGDAEKDQNQIHASPYPKGKKAEFRSLQKSIANDEENRRLKREKAAKQNGPEYVHFRVPHHGIPPVLKQRFLECFPKTEGENRRNCKRDTDNDADAEHPANQEQPLWTE
jgi:hypothetical protein